MHCIKIHAHKERTETESGDKKNTIHKNQAAADPNEIASHSKGILKMSK